jgi:hypothetical protein
MNCPRCNSPAHKHESSGGEHSLMCNICGYFTARIIDTFVDDYPIFKYVEQKPLGVVVTKGYNRQYYTRYQCSSLLIECKDCIGYTLCKNGEWLFYDIKKNKHIPVSSVAEVYF